MPNSNSENVFYGWWIVLAAFLNLFFAVGVIFYGFPVLYPSLVQALGITRAQATQGFFLGFLIVGLPFGLLAGAVIDRIGARIVILAGVCCIGVSLVAMGFISRFWEYEALCVLEVLGYVLAGPISNQVLIARWFKAQRGRAMGYAYLGLGLGGVVSPPLITFLIQAFGWRRAVEMIGALVAAVLLPVGLWITRSTPENLGLQPDGVAVNRVAAQTASQTTRGSVSVGAAVLTGNFWLIIAGTTLVIGAIGAVTQHFILFLKDVGYSASVAARFSTALLASSLAGRVLVGYLADRLQKRNTMAFCYFLLGSAIPLLFLAQQTVAAWSFALVFGFSMGADYMLIPLVTAECFGTASLGKLLSLIVMVYSLGQWGAPWITGRIFDHYHSYALAWTIMAAAGVLGAVAIRAISGSTSKPGAPA
jgi:MFS family permease